MKTLDGLGKTFSSPGKTIKRYGRLYLKFVEFSIGRAMEFRLDFYFRIVMDLLYNLSALGFFKVLFLHTNSIGGWSEPQVYIFIGFYIVVDAINMTLNAYPVDSPYGISDDCLCGQAGLSKDNARVSRAICKPEGLPGIFGESPLA